MADTVYSADGTPIAYEKTGSGPVVVLVSGMFCDRHIFDEWVSVLSPDHTVVTYDRRGRGDSGDTQPYAVEREVEDLAAVLEAVGAPATAYGHSSGAALVLEAAALGAPVAQIVLHDAPYGTDEAASVEQSRELARRIDDAIAGGRPGEAISAFMRSSGMPPERAEQMAKSPGLIRTAHTMPYDMAVMGNAARGRVVPTDVAARIRVPALLVVGERNPPFFHAAAKRLAEAIPGAETQVLAGVGHEAPAELVAATTRAFLSRPRGATGS